MIHVRLTPTDRTKFEVSGKSISINPKNGVEEFADYVIKDSLSGAIS